MNHLPTKGMSKVYENLRLTLYIVCVCTYIKLTISYISRVFHEVATIPLPKTIDLEDLVCDLEVKKEEDFEVQTE